MLDHQERSTAIMDTLVGELREDGRQRAIEHRELMQALMGMVRTRDDLSR